MKAAFGFVQMAGQITSAAAGVASAKGGMGGGGSKAEDLEAIYDMIESVADLVTTIVELAEMIQDVVELTATLADLKSASAEVSDVVDDLVVPSNPEAVMATCEAAASMRVKLVVWENLKNIGDTQLTGDPIDDVGGSADYHKALADISNWGKAMTQQALDHADLLNAYAVEALATKIAKDNVALMQNLLNQATSNQQISDQMLQVGPRNSFQIT